MSCCCCPNSHLILCVPVHALHADPNISLRHSSVPREGVRGGNLPFRFGEEDSSPIFLELSNLGILGAFGLCVEDAGRAHECQPPQRSRGGWPAGWNSAWLMPSGTLSPAPLLFLRIQEMTSSLRFLLVMVPDVQVRPLAASCNEKRVHGRNWDEGSSTQTTPPSYPPPLRRVETLSEKSRSKFEKKDQEVPRVLATTTTLVR
jgi:hypothetical protein